MIIEATYDVQEYIGRYFTNYDFAYVGENFTKAFIDWSHLFAQDLVNAYYSLHNHYIGRTCTIRASFFRLISGEILMYITFIAMNPIMIHRTYFNSHLERLSKGVHSVVPPLISSTKIVADYEYYSDGGIYGRHIIDIVKKKRCSKKKPHFNYYDRNTRAIMFDYDFYSAFPFHDDEAEAWATDGHKYLLPTMTLIENKNKIGTIINEVVKKCLNEMLIKNS